jgi:hypothetical protein
VLLSIFRVEKIYLGRHGSDWEEDMGQSYKGVVRNVVNQNYGKSSSSRSWYRLTETMKW